MTRFDCDDVLSKLDELVDGVLDEPEATIRRAHLEACAGCRAEHDRALRLAELTRSLPRSIEPDRDLWPGIASRIEQRRVVSGRFGRPGSAERRWMVALAASAVLAVSVTAAYLLGLRQAQPTVAEAPPAATTYTRATYGELTDELQEARDLLRAGLDRRRDDLSRETWSVVMDNMAVIDDAIERIEIALEDNPNDDRLNRQLALAYRRQIDLLQRATRLPSEA